jgi:hypothetical protein
LFLSQVAKEMLTRSKNEAGFTRTELQLHLDRLLAEAALQREKLEQTTAAELKVVTAICYSALGFIRPALLNNLILHNLFPFYPTP